MTVLSDGTIRAKIEAGEIGVEPFDPSLIQPASLDIRLGYVFRIFRNERHTHVDVRESYPNLTEETVQDSPDDPFILHPHEFALGTTLETFVIPTNMLARLEGKSSLGRLAVQNHSTAGFIDPGFRGRITLELSNSLNIPVLLYPEMEIGQLAFQLIDKEVEEPYGSDKRKSKYQDQNDPKPSQMHRNFEKSAKPEERDPSISTPQEK